MRNIIITVICVLALSACAKDEHSNCEHQASAETVVYPDGVSRKSEVYVCSNGCIWYSDVDHRIDFFHHYVTQFNSCERF